VRSPELIGVDPLGQMMPQACGAVTCIVDSGRLTFLAVNRTPRHAKKNGIFCKSLHAQ